MDLSRRYALLALLVGACGGSSSSGATSTTGTTKYYDGRLTMTFMMLDWVGQPEDTVTVTSAVHVTVTPPARYGSGDEQNPFHLQMVSDGVATLTPGSLIFSSTDEFLYVPPFSEPMPPYTLPERVADDVTGVVREWQLSYDAGTGALDGDFIGPPESANQIGSALQSWRDSPKFEYCAAYVALGSTIHGTLDDKALVVTVAGTTSPGSCLGGFPFRAEVDAPFTGRR